MKIIEISIETHNTDDPYYKESHQRMFYTIQEYSNEDINEILNNIKPKQYEDKENYSYGEMEIDVNDLIEKLIEHDIYPVISDVMHYYEIEE